MGRDAANDGEVSQVEDVHRAVVICLNQCDLAVRTETDAVSFIFGVDFTPSENIEKCKVAGDLVNVDSRFLCPYKGFCSIRSNCNFAVANSQVYGEGRVGIYVSYMNLIVTTGLPEITVDQLIFEKDEIWLGRKRVNLCHGIPVYDTCSADVMNYMDKSP